MGSGRTTRSAGGRTTRRSARRTRSSPSRSRTRGSRARRSDVTLPSAIGVFVVGALGDVATTAARADGPSAREALGRARAAIASFHEQAGVERTVVVHLASTEPRDPEAESLADDAALERRLDDLERPPPASLVWALAAIESG